MDNIFALNNQVFGSSFRERRVSSRTRRAMRSELIIPDSAVEMTYSDMCLVNGGGTISLTVTTGVFGNMLGSIAGKAIRAGGFSIVASMISANIAATLNIAGAPFAAPSFGIVPILLTVAAIVIGSLLASKLIDMGVDAFLNWANLRPTLFQTSASNWFLPNLSITL